MLRLDIPITKVDAARRLVYGVATAETADRAGEICDYASTKPFYEKWSRAIAASTGGRSYGNLRAMHGPVAAGKVTALAFNDEAKQIEICAKVVDDAEWSKVAEGVYTGFSQGGTYARRWTDDTGATRYTADPQEISLVDLPCLAEARFEMIKADGSHEWRRFRGEVDKGGARNSAGLDKVGARNSAGLDKVGARNSAGLDKVGARNSAADQERLQAMHDTSVDLGARCPAQKALGGPGTLDALDELLAKRLAAMSENLGKTLGEVFAGKLAEAVAGLSARLAAIEAQPQPLPFAPGLRAVAKTHDGQGHDGQADVEALLADPGALSLLAIKLAQRQRR